MTIDIAEKRREHTVLLASELERLVEELKGLGASLIVLFGSYARGRRDLFTDLDIMAVMESDRPFVLRHGELYATLQPCVPADIVVYTPDEFAQMRDRPFLRHILQTGKILYARS